MGKLNTAPRGHCGSPAFSNFHTAQFSWQIPKCYQLSPKRVIGSSKLTKDGLSPCSWVGSLNRGQEVGFLQIEQIYVSSKAREQLSKYFYISERPRVTSQGKDRFITLAHMHQVTGNLRQPRRLDIPTMMETIKSNPKPRKIDCESPIYSHVANTLVYHWPLNVEHVVCDGCR